MATAIEIFNQAVERSNLNDSSLVGETEWLDWLTILERRIFIAGARENPDYFGLEGNTAARATLGTWSLTTSPGDIAAVSRVEVAAITGTVTGITVGDEVNVVSIRHPETALSPRVYIRSKIIHDYGSELETDASNLVTTLKIFYSLLPADRTATTDSLDLPDEHNALVVVPLAALLATRDQRPEEAQLLNAEFALEFGNFIQQVSAFDEVVVRELEQVPASSRRIEDIG